jgi:hypothetical protein
MSAHLPPSPDKGNFGSFNREFHIFNVAFCQLSNLSFGRGVDRCKGFTAG